MGLEFLEVECLYHLHVAVDVESVILGGEDDGAVLHERHVEALRVLDLALERAEQLAGLAEHRQVEVVVVVRDADLPGGGEAHADGEVGDALAPDLPQVIAVVVKNLDTVGAVVGDENLHGIVDDNSVGELKIPKNGHEFKSASSKNS